MTDRISPSDRAVIEYTLQGIPCLIHLTSYQHEPPKTSNPRAAQLPEDLYGLEEIEYEIRDRRGYRAPWLEQKITPAEDERIRDYISEEMARRRTEARIEAEEAKADLMRDRWY